MPEAEPQLDSSGASLVEPQLQPYAKGCSLKERSVATLVPDQGHVVLGHCHRRGWQVRHELSREVVFLPKQQQDQQVVEWSLEFVGEGCGLAVACLANGDAIVAPLGDIFDTSVYADAEGHIYISHPDKEGDGSSTLLDEALRDMTLCTADLGTFGDCRQRLLLSVGVFRLPRPCGCQVVWALPSIYAALGLEMRRGCSDWLAALSSAWQKHCDAMGLGCRLLKGFEGRGRSKRVSTDDSADITPWRAASSVGLLAILARLSAPARFGGIRDEDPNTAVVRKLLIHLLEKAGAGCWTLSLSMDCSHRVSPFVKLGNEQGLFIDWEVEDCFVRWPLPPLPPALCGSLADVFFDGKAHLAEILGAAQAHASGRFLVAQLVMEFGQKLDSLALDGSNPEISLEGYGNDMCTSDAQAMRTICLLRENSSRIVGDDVMFLSGTGDKSRVGGLGIYNGVAVLPSNQAVALPPQVGVRHAPMRGCRCDGCFGSLGVGRRRANGRLSTLGQGQRARSLSPSTDLRDSVWPVAVLRPSARWPACGWNLQGGCSLTR